MRKEFQTKLQSMGPKGAWTALLVPFNVEKVFGSKARISVKGTINGFRYRTSIFPMGDGTHMMMVNKRCRRTLMLALGKL